MLMDIIVYTSITNNYDTLKLQPTFLEDKEHRVQYTAYLDKTTTEVAIRSEASAQWSIKDTVDNFKEPKRNCQIPKILSHLYTFDFEYSIWIDGSVKLKSSLTKLIEDNVMEGPDMALLWHSQRDCVYKEAEDCLHFKLDDSNTIYEQLNFYRKLGLPEHYGLSETPVIIRRNTNDVAIFNNLWWAIISKYSRRDQLSFDFVRWTMKIPVDHIDGNIFNNDYFTLDKHIILKEHEKKLDKNY